MQNPQGTQGECPVLSPPGGPALEDGVALRNEGMDRGDAGELLVYFRYAIKLRDLRVVGLAPVSQGTW